MWKRAGGGDLEPELGTGVTSSARATSTGPVLLAAAVAH